VYNKKIIEDRAFLLRKIRNFFYKKNILEVDCPILTKYPSIDTHIESMKTKFFNEEIGYLHTSPEYLMKRLLSKGVGDIYQISHVFRKDEVGSLHNMEFTLIEWYRKNISYKKFILEVIELIQIFLGNLSFSKTSFKKIFYKYTKIDIEKTNKKTLYEFAKKNINLATPFKNIDKDSIMMVIMNTYIEPNIGKNKITIIDNYPLSQSALAKTKKINNSIVSERFEFFFKGIELGNGYHELTDYKEQKKRFIKINKERKNMKKEILPIDKKLLLALKKGLGNCYGIAIGFDRLMMLRHKKSSIKDVILFPYEDL